MTLDLNKGFVYNEGVVRTDLDCTDCSKIFVAKLNFDLNGNHVIRCPHCGHKHYRTIKNGVVTGDRYDSQAGPNQEVPTERQWSSRTKNIQTTTASEHIRSKWIGG